LDEVRLPDLETIRRFSIAVRQEHAPVDDVMAALRIDLERLERATSAKSAGRTTRKRSTSASKRRTR
jgi:hypothetical protein